ncbi:MAG: 50S ribosomal protein L22 [Candidatus Woesearchaeota archaeon]
MAYKYAYQGTEENVAKAAMTNVAISTKASAMIAQFIKNKSPQRARKELQEVLKKTTAIPYTRYTEGAGHKTKIGPGKYPKKSSETFIKLIDSAVANAKDKGLEEEKLLIIASSAHQAPRGFNSGRKRGQRKKNSHIELVVAEVQE